MLFVRFSAEIVLVSKETKAAALLREYQYALGCYTDAQGGRREVRRGDNWVKHCLQHDSQIGSLP